jgi:cysteine sulfinate desulfinase/cysteine desulfurase-like protein
MKLEPCNPFKKLENCVEARKLSFIIFHCDAAQMLGKLPIDVDEMKIDLMSMSSRDIYGPERIGELYVRRRPRVIISISISRSEFESLLLLLVCEGAIPRTSIM